MIDLRDLDVKKEAIIQANRAIQAYQVQKEKTYALYRQIYSEEIVPVDQLKAADVDHNGIVDQADAAVLIDLAVDLFFR